MFNGMNYINGSWQTESLSFKDHNPCNEEVIGIFPYSNKDKVNAAVSAAREAFKTWKLTSRVKRAELFDNLAQIIKQFNNDLARIISLETGKNLNESVAEVNESLHMIQYTAAMGREPYGQVVSSELQTKDAYVIRKPRGVVGIVSPWNFPAAICSTWNSGPAIIEGNCVVIKPSELTPMSAQFFVEMYEKAGFPPGVINLIHGDGETGKNLVEADVDVILFTGSAEVGQSIRQHCASTWNKTCSLELGSKSAVVVFDDANMDIALEASIASAFKLSGQRCVSSGRILIQRNVYREFVENFVNRASTIFPSNPFDKNPGFYGPLISKEHYQRVESFNTLVRNDNEAKVRLEGAGGNGNFMHPFVYETEWRDVPYLKQEVFGPNVALVPFDDVDDAIRIYNDTQYGLALGVITNNFKTHRRMQQECDTGMLYINGSSIGAESHLPFTGLKKSGNGHSSAAGTYEAVTYKMAVTVNYGENLQFAQGMK
jgi:aldehyde dehydrogenase (NAD+)